ncbi:MAG: hypothetical protein K1X74_02515 [Pirellulales bacterium]|nr:hypothetical protein [Pirellulales bacterium]
MSESHASHSNEVDQLLLNARLRDELEPYLDESISQVGPLPTQRENEYLASMLAWERAPVLPIAEWFSPPLVLPPPSELNDVQLHTLLWETIRRLHAKRIVLDFTDHLSDHQLYCLIYRDILPSYEKKIESSRHYLHWDCANMGDDPEIWLRHYASEEERLGWSDQTGQTPPPHVSPPYPRHLPHHPL